MCLERYSGWIGGREIKLEEVRPVIIGSWPEVTIAGIPGRDGLALSPPSPCKVLSAESCVCQTVLYHINGEGGTQKGEVSSQISLENAELNRFLNAGLFRIFRIYIVYVI